MGIKNYQPVFLLFSSIILSAAAQLLMKAGLLAFQLSGLSTDNGLWFLVDGLLANQHILLWLGGGIICYGLSMLAWLLALTRYQISYAYPMLGLSYVLVYLGAVYWHRIGESFSTTRSVGILLVLLGVVLVNIKPAVQKPCRLHHGGTDTT